jgi:hypothetical protein
LYIVSLTDGTIYRIIPQYGIAHIESIIIEPPISYMILVAISLVIIAIYATYRIKSRRKINA